MNPMNDPMNTVDEGRIRDGITLARNMRNNGASLESIESRLLGRGFDERAVRAVMSHIPSEEPDNIIVKPQAETGRMGLVLIGLTISVLGALLALGNQTGLAPSVPFFGFAVMVVGGVIMAAGRS
jgi:hypothetical protein